MNNYEMIYKVKQLLYNVINIKEIQELDLFISEFKAFISNERILEEEYKKRIQNYRDKYNTGKKNYMTFAKIVDKILNYNDCKIGINNQENNKSLDLAIGSVAYFPIMHKIMGNNEENIQAYSSVSEFYYQNIFNYFLESNNYNIQEKKNIITRISKILSIYCKNSEIIPLIDFVALTLEDQCVYGRSYIVKTPFYFLWLKSAVIGVLYELQSFLKKPLENECTQNEIIQLEKTISFTHREEEIITLYRQGCSSLKELQNKMNITESTVKKHLKNINNKCGSKGTGLKALKENLKNRHHL